MDGYHVVLVVVKSSHLLVLQLVELRTVQKAIYMAYYQVVPMTGMKVHHMDLDDWFLGFYNGCDEGYGGVTEYWWRLSCPEVEKRADQKG